MTSVVKERCKVEQIRDLKYKECKRSTKILEPSVFCPFPLFKHPMIFDSSKVKLVLSKLEEHQSYAIRIWSKMNANVESWGNSDSVTPFYKLAEKKCPLVFQLCGEAGRF